MDEMNARTANFFPTSSHPYLHPYFQGEEEIEEDEELLFRRPPTPNQTNADRTVTFKVKRDG